jgi:hypothetical protein
MLIFPLNGDAGTARFLSNQKFARIRADRTASADRRPPEGLPKLASAGIIRYLAVGGELKGLAYGWYNFTIGIATLPSSLIFRAVLALILPCSFWALQQIPMPKPTTGNTATPPLEKSQIKWPTRVRSSTVGGSKSWLSARLLCCCSPDRTTACVNVGVAQDRVDRFRTTFAGRRVSE